MTSRRSKIVGLDLSLTGTGLAVLAGQHASLHRFGTGTAGDEWDARLGRLESLTEAALSYVCAGPAPRLVVLEAPAYSRTTGQVHDRAGYWWSVYRALRQRGLPVLVIEPTRRAKYATGRGNAGKDEVLAAVVRRYPWAEVANNDHADALALAALGSRLLGQPVEESLPQAHLSALDGVSLTDIL